MFAPFALRRLRGTPGKRWGVVALLVVTLSCGVARSPVYACDKYCESPDANAAAGVLVATLKAGYFAILEQLELIRSALASITGSINGRGSTMRKLQAKLEQARVDTAHTSKAIRESAYLVAEQMGEPEVRDLICNAAKAGLGDDYARGQGGGGGLQGRMAVSVLRIVRDRRVGTGPAAVADLLKGACKSTRSMHPLDSPPLQCISTNPDDWDGTLSAYAVLPGEGRVYSWPKLKEQTVGGIKYYEIDYADALKPGNEEQAGFARAVEYCYTLAGVRPIPPQGQQMPRRSEGYVQFDECAVAESAFMEACVQNIIYMTRPECENGGCTASNQACGAARAFVKLPTEFDVCGTGAGSREGKGASPFQEDWMKILRCSSAQFITAAASAPGATKATEYMVSLQCQENRLSFNAKVLRLHHHLAEAARGVREIRGCWQGVDRGPKVRTQP